MLLRKKNTILIRDSFMGVSYDNRMVITNLSQPVNFFKLIFNLNILQ